MEKFVQQLIQENNHSILVLIVLRQKLITLFLQPLTFKNAYIKKIIKKQNK